MEAAAWAGGKIVCDQCGELPTATEARGLKNHQDRWCHPQNTWVCTCTRTFTKFQTFQGHQEQFNCVGQYVAEEEPPALKQHEAAEDTTASVLSDVLRKRACIPAVPDVPIFTSTPAYQEGSISLRYLEQQVRRELEDQAFCGEAGMVRDMNEMEAHFLAITEKFRLPHRACDQIIQFCRKWTTGGRAGLFSASYRSMRASARAEVDVSDTMVYNRLKVDVDPKYTEHNQPFVYFESIDILSVIVDIFTDPAVVRSLDDLNLKHEVVLQEDGQRVFTPEVNSGLWQERTERVLFGPNGNMEITLGPIIIFIDGVALTKRGDQSAKPIMVTLACLKAEVRQRKVCVLILWPRML